MGKIARLDYRPYRNRRENDVHAGVMEIHFTSLRRLTSAKVYWQDADRDKSPLPYEVTISLYEPKQIQRKRIKRGQPGPRPSEWSEITSREDGITYTYLMRFGTRDVWKLGISKDPEQRRDALNFSVPEEVLGERWDVVKQREWPSGARAWKMEQAILGALNSYRAGCERVSCEKPVIDAAWSKYRPRE